MASPVHERWNRGRWQLELRCERCSRRLAWWTYADAVDDLSAGRPEVFPADPEDPLLGVGWRWQGLQAPIGWSPTPTGYVVVERCPSCGWRRMSGPEIL